MVLLILLPLLGTSGCAQGNTAKKPVPQEEQPANKTLLEAAAKDPYEDGCVSCHKKTEEVDRSLPVYVDKIPGHPEVKDATVNSCYNCHEAEKNYSLYKKFYTGIHRPHWESETFYVKQKANCFSCHTVESNGVSGIKNYPLAGYRAGVTGQKTGKSAAPREQQNQIKQTTEEKKTEQPKQGEEQQETQNESEKATRGEEIPTPTP